ncbi:MAG: hypothetical protein HDT14_08090 [Oscillibacter sp.]|nr:hypothetical protein [Oscillibacter sp.]
MKIRERLGPALLAAVMFISLLPPLTPAARGAEAVTGSISATVRIDYDQSLSELQKRQVRAELLQGNRSLGSVDLTRPGVWPLSGGYAAAVSLRDADGGELYGQWPGYLDVSVDGLPQGVYTLRFSGRGYTDCEETFTMEEYARHVIVGTGDATFSLGDFNGDGRVDARDRGLLSDALGSGEREDLQIFDLNGDGEIDIIDLAYVNRQIAAGGGAQLLETVLLAPPVDAAALEAELEQLGVTTLSGNPGDLLRQNGKAVTFQANHAGEIVLPFSFRQTTQLEQLQIVSSDYAPILAGMVEVEDETGGVSRYAFDQTLPEGIRALSVQEGSSVITIDLGRRVAVKKVTVTVTKTETGYATVESIQFLKEMVPADPSAAESQVTGLAAVEGSERVSLSWNALPNVSGYRVTWWPAANPARTSTLYVETNRAEITGLENLTAYQFTVTAVDGSWSGKASAPVTATPQPARAPDAPDMVSVSALDGALSVSWKASGGATWYEVYYTSVENAPAASYARWDGTLTGTSTTITGLANDTTYYIYIIAGNDVGRSGPSRISTGTPRAVVYARPAGIPTEGVLDYRDFQSIRLAAPANYSRTECPDFSPWHMADGDWRTHWTVRDWWSNEHVIVTFREPQDLSAAIWVPRLDGTYSSNLRTYSVQVWYDGEDLNGPGHLVTPGTDHNNMSQADVDSWPNVRGNPSETKFAIMPFTPQRNVVQVSVAAEQRAYTALSLTELMFLKYDENHRLPDEIGELFADQLRTTLAYGVTQARIDQLRARLNSEERHYYLDLQALADELDLAQELLAGRTGSGVLLNGIDSRSGSRDSANCGQSGSALQPLGVAAAANTEITIYAQGIPAGETVTVYATQFNAEASAWQASMGTLENGRNVLTVPRIGSQNTARGGSLYVSYGGTNPGGIRLHVRRGTAIPVLDLSDWNTLGDAARTQTVSAYLAELDGYLSGTAIGSDQADWRNVTEIATPGVLLSLPARAVQSGLKGDRTAQLLGSVEAWEELMEICRTVQGITGTMETRQNIRCMQMFSGAFMYAAGSHIGIGYGSCAGMVGGSSVRNLAANASSNSLFGWGIAHEIGHNMDKLGKAEITNNIYSLAVQTYDGKQNTLPSRLEQSGKYAAIFNKTAQGCPGASNDVFVQLGLYWQLHLAYDDGVSPLNFYSRFFTAWKAGTYFNGASTYDDKVALTASAVAGRDLTEFFTRWGMTLSAETKTRLSAYARESRAVWYLNDQSRRDRLAGVPAADGAVSASAVRDGNNSVILSFRTDLTNAGKVQGYEIRRNGAAIAFTTGNTYTDTIGTGNNRTYQYTVAAYDTLGNCIGEAPAGEVRVAYDLTLDAGSYAMTRAADGTLRVTMAQPAAVTGLRLPAGTDLSGLQLSITENGTDIFAGHTQDANRTDAAITYFQRPGADASQASQVWTYQATALTISGLPAGITERDVQLISYMGDDIAFLDGPTVGVMAQDYRYGPGPDDVIKQGTLVITGTYRGDPTYNTIRIQGDFANPDMAEANQGEAPASAGTTRYLNGEAILFASESSDQTYTNISDGIFIFIPDVQAEKELTDGGASCGAVSVLPSRIRAELWRTVAPDSTEGTRMTAQTLWISSPGGSDLPLVDVKGGGQ